MRQLYLPRVDSAGEKLASVHETVAVPGGCQDTQGCSQIVLWTVQDSFAVAETKNQAASPGRGQP